jgi:hypothetical protein
MTLKFHLRCLTSSLRLFLRAFAKLRKATVSFVMCLSVRPSVRMEQLGSHCENNWVSFKSDKNNGYFIWRPMCIWQYPDEFFLEWEMFQTKVVEKIKTRILGLIAFFRNACHLRDNVDKYGRARQATGDNIIRCMWVVCWITKATDTHSEYVILIALPRQQWLRERASVLRYTYIACLV